LWLYKDKIIDSKGFNLAISGLGEIILDLALDYP
jgi:hypothetical protein